MDKVTSDRQRPPSAAAPVVPATRAARKAARTQRLAAELKFNLRRRKAQARARAQEAAANDASAVDLGAGERAASHNCAGIAEDKVDQ
jgi:hypothetical protein